MRKTLEKPNKKPELTESRQQALEDLGEMLVDLLNADLSEGIKEKIQELIDLAGNEVSGNGDAEESN